MKHIYLAPHDSDVRTVIESQAKRFISDEDLLIWDIEDEFKSSFQGLLQSDLGEYVVLCPRDTILIENPDFKQLDIVAGEMSDRGLDYTQLRKIGNSSANKLENSSELYKDECNRFVAVPHVFKTDSLRDMIDKSRDRDELYWISLQTGALSGAFFHRVGAQPQKTLSYWKCPIYHAISDILTPDGLWNDTHIDFNNKVLAIVLSDLGIDSTIRGVGSIGGCCHDLG